VISGGIVAALIAALVGSLLYGATAGLVIFGLSFFVGSGSIFYWAFFGLPTFISQIVEIYGLDATAISVFEGAILGLTAVVWFWFILGFVTQRYMEQ